MAQDASESQRSAGQDEPEIKVQPITATSHLPLWYQVAQSLRAAIQNRSPHASLRLPVETALAARFGVSVGTVRQALGSLESEGLITRQRRRGTFINPDTVPSARLEVFGSVDTVIAQQTDSGVEVEILVDREMPVPEQLREHYPRVESVRHLRRLRRQGGVPVSISENWTPSGLAAGIQPEQLRQHSSMTRLLRDSGEQISRAENFVEAALPTAEQSELLHLGPGAPVLRLRGVTYSTGDEVIDVVNLLYRGDRFSYAVTMNFET